MLTNERGELTVDAMTGEALVNGEKGRPLPWLDVPGFTPPQVQKIAAETIARSGIVVSLPMPQVSTPQTETQANTATGTTPEVATKTAPKSQEIPADARPVSEVMKADSAKRAAEAEKAATGTQPASTQATAQPAKTQTQAGATQATTQNAAQAAGTAQNASATQTPATTQSVISIPQSVKTFQQPKQQAAMPQDDDWDLPENFNSKNAFVPIEADAD